jgi:hypothetical protein
VAAAVLAAGPLAAATTIFPSGPPRTPCRDPSPPLPRRTAPAAHGGLIAGLSIALDNYQGNQACNLLKATRATGAAAIREDLDWSVVSPRRGARNWSAFDRIIGEAASWGLIVLPLLDGRPSWVRGPGDFNRAFASFTATAVARYGPGGAFWRAHPGLASAAPVWFELWNEPYLIGPTRMTAPAYAQLVVAAVKAGRRANPVVRYLAEAENTYPRTTGGLGNWIDDLFAARPDLGQYVDAFAAHPYATPPPAPYDPSNPVLQVGRVEAIHDRIVADDSVLAPIWITELGWSTCTKRPPCVSLPQQASDVTALFALARTRWAAYVRAVFIFGYTQAAVNPTPPGELNGFGLVDGDQRPKPALGAFEAAAAMRR